VSDRSSVRQTSDREVRRRELRVLFPYTSLMSLCFSRCTRYPFTRVDPSIWCSKVGRDHPLWTQQDGEPDFIVVGANEHPLLTTRDVNKAVEDAASINRWKGADATPSTRRSFHLRSTSVAASKPGVPPSAKALEASTD
jgi:hypothetical protein